MISLVLVFVSMASSLGWAMPHEGCPSTCYIVGGRDTDIKEVPYIASVFYNGIFTCGATIVSEKYLLTAAHCISRRNPYGFHVRVGSSYREKGGVKHQVKLAIGNSNFSGITFDYDVGVLELQDPLEFDRNVQPIGIVDVEPQGGEMAKISGFGRTKEGVLAKQLQSVEIPIYDRESCNNAVQVNVTPRMICAYIEGVCKSAFHGDSGGPIVVKGKVAGAVSWGYPPNPGLFPNGFANFAEPSIRAFIRKHTGL